jgi:hypothetical protein
MKQVLRHWSVVNGICKGIDREDMVHVTYQQSS